MTCYNNICKPTEKIKQKINTEKTEEKTKDKTLGGIYKW